MLKRLSLALAGLFAFVAAAQGAGTIPGFSLTPQFDLTGKVAPGCKLYVYQAGTVATPQNAYQDSGLTNPETNPVLCDAAGRLPQFFLADGLIKLRLTTSTGTQIYVGDNLLVVGASSGGGGGGGGTVDPTTILGTGDFKLQYNNSTLAGFVRCNGRTIGSATSGASERANADTSALYTFLYNIDANLTVSGGRGANAAADFAANKTLTLPECRGRALAGLADMGNSDIGLFSGVTFSSGNATTLGSLVGAAKTSLSATNIPPITSTNPSQSITVNPAGNPSLFAAISQVGWNYTTTGSTAGCVTNCFPWNTIGNTPTATNAFVGSNSISVTSTGTSGTAATTASPYVLLTIYIKL